MPKKKVEVKTEETKPLVTYLGKGGLDGEYLFKEIAGSVSARSLEEATQKAEELALKHPDLLVK